MQVDVDINAASAVLRLRKGPKKLVYLMVNALNATATEVQGAVQKRIRDAFTVRKERFIADQVKIDKARFSLTGASRWEARVYVAQETKRLLLPKFEEGALRRPSWPGFAGVAAPILGGPARPTKATPTPQALTFPGLDFKLYTASGQVKRRRRGRTVNETVFTEFGRHKKKLLGGQWKGAQRTYLLPGVGVFQRTGKGRGATRAVWLFLRPFQLDKRLRFYDTARKALRGSFEANVKKGVDDAFEHEAARASR